MELQELGARIVNRVGSTVSSAVGVGGFLVDRYLFGETVSGSEELWLCGYDHSALYLLQRGCRNLNGLQWVDPGGSDAAVAAGNAHPTRDSLQPYGHGAQSKFLRLGITCKSHKHVASVGRKNSTSFHLISLTDIVHSLRIVGWTYKHVTVQYIAYLMLPHKCDTMYATTTVNFASCL